MKIRSQLLLVMVMSLFLMTSLVAGVQMYTAYTQAKQNMQGILQNQATQFSNQVETWFTLVRQSGHLFANEFFVQNASSEEMQKLLGNMHNELNAFDNLIVTKPNGSISNIYPHNPSIIGQSMSGYSYFQDTIAAKTSQISKVMISPTTGKAVIAITQPILNENGDLIAVLLQNIKLDLLQDISEDAKIGQTGQTIVFTSDGKVIAPQSNESAGFISYVPSTLSELFKKDLRSVGEFIRADGEPVIVATTRVKTPGWGIAVTITQGEVLHSFYDSIKYGVVTFGIIFLLLSFVSSIIFNKLFRSITTVTQHFASMNEGNFAFAQISEDVIHFAPQELKKLCTTFNTMSQTIQNNMDVIRKTHEQLEIKVEERTEDLVAMNEELQALNQELQQTLENLQQTQDQLVQSEKMASLGSLVAGIAHEINTPVGVGVTATSHLQKVTKEFSQLYASGELKRRDLSNYLVESEEALSIIFSNLERASQLIRSFKQVSVDQSSEARRVFNIKQYLSEILLSLHPKLKRTKHKITVQCDEKLKMDSFPGAFGQIITNLIMNSLIHAYEPDQAGELTITILQEADKTLLVYSDDGKGMDKDVVSQIFNPFFTTKRGMGGTGLGLYILYNLVKQQFGGTIECESELGKGTKFVIDIPVGKETHHGK
ncbi:MAG: multi-sensor signal transduction histidine kinase [Pelosinus sp.]|jgi:C4-dicarboxylate-specific signal transduction histidine kinase|nr:multi-sensor signal transduction histidine kinase [Pelosinus sp.]